MQPLCCPPVFPAAWEGEEIQRRRNGCKMGGPGDRADIQRDLGVSCQGGRDERGGVRAEVGSRGTQSPASPPAWPPHYMPGLRGLQQCLWCVRVPWLSVPQELNAHTRMCVHTRTPHMHTQTHTPAYAHTIYTYTPHTPTHICIDAYTQSPASSSLLEKFSRKTSISPHLPSASARRPQPARH